MLDKIKLLLGLADNSQDDLISLLIEESKEEAINFTHNKETELDACIIQMVVYKYNRIGTEGLNSENYSGVSFNYSADYPESILRQLRAKRVIW